MRTEFYSLPVVGYQEGLNGEHIETGSNFQWLLSIGRIQLVVCHHSNVSVFLPCLWSMELSNLCCSTPLLDLKEKFKLKLEARLYIHFSVKKKHEGYSIMHFACRYFLINKTLMTQKALITDNWHEHNWLKNKHFPEHKTTTSVSILSLRLYLSTTMHACTCIKCNINYRLYFYQL